MVKLHFKTTEEFEVLFKSKKRNVTDAIVDGIQQAMMNRKKTAQLFEITFEEEETMFDISLPRAEWQQALSASLEHYHELEADDECIDTWKLLEAVKVL